MLVPLSFPAPTKQCAASVGQSMQRAGSESLFGAAVSTFGDSAQRNPRRPNCRSNFVYDENLLHFV
jgi:hypothetical protein